MLGYVKTLSSDANFESHIYLNLGFISWTRGSSVFTHAALSAAIDPLPRFGWLREHSIERVSLFLGSSSLKQSSDLRTPLRGKCCRRYYTHHKNCHVNNENVKKSKSINRVQTVGELIKMFEMSSFVFLYEFRIEFVLSFYAT